MAKDKKDKKEIEEITKETEYIEEEEASSDEFVKKIKKLKEKLEACRKDKEEYLIGWQKERADFVNYKKFEAEKSQDMAVFQKISVFFEFLPIIDNIERAEKELPDDLREGQWGKGFLGILSQIKDFLNKEGVKEMEAGDQFNPELHEAIEIVKGEEDDKIVEVVQKGYLIQDKVLRPARVRVGKK